MNVACDGVLPRMLALRHVQPGVASSKTIAAATRQGYALTMHRPVANRNVLTLFSFLVAMCGCGGAPPAHRFAPPVLPAMDESNSPATAKQSTVKTNEAPQSPSTLSSVPTQPDPVVAKAVNKEPGRASGPCPSAIDQSPHILANALEMEKKTTDPGPHRAIAEAIRMRLDALFQHGCHRRLDDEHLLETVAQMAPDPKEFAERLSLKSQGDLGIVASYGTYWAGFLAHYRWHEGMIRTSILVTGEHGDLDKQLLVLTAKLAKLPDYPDPILVLGHTHPWVSSCWRAMRIRILAPSSDPIHPKVFLDKLTGGRWCEGITSEIRGETVSFSFDDWGGPWSMGLVQRPYTYTYRYEGGAFVEHFGFPARFENLPEDWLMRDWSLAQDATVEGARMRLRPMQEQMHKALTDHQKAHASGSDSEYTQELFPVSDTARRIALYCAQRETGKPCKEWPKPVDFFIERQDGMWYVKDVVPRQ